MQIRENHINVFLLTDPEGIGGVDDIAFMDCSGEHGRRASILSKKQNQMKEKNREL